MKVALKAISVRLRNPSSSQYTRRSCRGLQTCISTLNLHSNAFLDSLFSISCCICLALLPPANMHNQAPTLPRNVGRGHLIRGRTYSSSERMSPTHGGRPNLGVGISSGGVAAAVEESPIVYTRPDRVSRPRNRKSEVFINYMVLGECGLGKTSFIYNLVSGFKVVHPGMAHLDNATTMRHFKADPSSLRTVLEPLELSECNTRLQISIQDMPGWGEDLNLRRYLRNVISYVLSRREKDYHLLGGSGFSPRVGATGASASMQLRHSITACLYFLPPHRVKQADLVMMSAVSQLVTVIPVIAKSDSMTEAELATYRQELTQMLQNPTKAVPKTGLQDFTVRTFPLQHSVLKLLGLQQLPVAVNCSRQKEACSDEKLLSMVGPHGLQRPLQPVRQYSWGASVYPYAREHQSDLIPLKRLLLGDQIETLQAMLNDSYKRYVDFCEEYAEYDEELQALVQEMWALAKPLEYDDYPEVRSCLDKMQQQKKMLQAENRKLKTQLAKAEAEVSERKERSAARWR